MIISVTIGSYEHYVIMIQRLYISSRISFFSILIVYFNIMSRRAPAENAPLPLDRFYIACFPVG
jgi:hypothetical protein